MTLPGHAQATQGPPPCNAVDGHDLLVAGFYTAGTLLVDFSDPTMPRVVQQMRFDDGSAWASYHYQGAVYTGDLQRGLDVFRFV